MSAKLCKDCKWSRREWLWFIVSLRRPYEFAKCACPVLSVRSPAEAAVDGGGWTRSAMRYCSSNRIQGCGLEGKHWEAR